MQVGDWAQVVVGILGILTTLFVARMVYRLERRDAAVTEQAKLVERKSDEEIAAKRERQKIERDRYSEDIRTATALIDEVEKFVRNIEIAGPLTLEEMKESGMRDVAEKLNNISKRVEPLSETLWIVSSHLTGLLGQPYPSSHAWSIASKELPVEKPIEMELSGVVKRAAVATYQQVNEAEAVGRAITSARKSIAKMWAAD